MANKPVVDKDLIRDLAALMDETGLTEIELGDGASRLRVARGGTVMAAPAPMAAAPATAGPVLAAILTSIDAHAAAMAQHGIM